MTKSDIKAFVIKVQKKALDAVREKYDKLIDDEIKETLRGTDIESCIKECEEKLKVLKTSLDKLEELVNKSKLFTDAHVWYGRNSSVVFNLKESSPTVYDALLRFKTVTTDRLNNLRKERDKALNDVRDNYRIIRNNIDTMRSTKKILNYL